AAECFAAEVVQQFFKDEGDGGDRGIEGRRYSRAHADRHHRLNPEFSESEETSEGGGEGAAMLDGRTLASEAVAELDGDRADDEPPEGSGGLDDAEVLIVGGFGLGNAGPGRARGHVLDHEPHDQAGGGGGED